MTQPTESQEPKSPREPGLSHSLDDLARMQGIGPADDLDTLAERWPADDDPDEFDAFIRTQRGVRRSVAHGMP